MKYIFLICWKKNRAIILIKELIFNAFHSSYFLSFTRPSNFSLFKQKFTLTNPQIRTNNIWAKWIALQPFFIQHESPKKKLFVQIKLSRCKTKSALSLLVICSNSFQKKMFIIVATKTILNLKNDSKKWRI